MSTCITCNQPPFEIPFCCLVVVPGGLVGTSRVFADIANNCVVCCEGTIESCATVEPPLECENPCPTTLQCPVTLKTLSIVGCVEVQAALGVRPSGTSGGPTTSICCRKCVCIDRILVCACCDSFTCDDVDINVRIGGFGAQPVPMASCPDGDQVYRITGSIMIDVTCPTCPDPPDCHSC